MNQLGAFLRQCRLLHSKSNTISRFVKGSSIAGKNTKGKLSGEVIYGSEMNGQLSA